MTPKNIHKIFKPKKFIFRKTPKTIEIQNVEPQIMARAYVCMKISEYPPPPPSSGNADPDRITGVAASHLCLLFLLTG